MRFTAIRRIPVLIGVAALATAALAGCTGAPGVGGCDPLITSGDASSLVTASGSLGASPKVDFPTPLISTTAEASVIEHGDGAQVRDGDQVDFSLSVFYGEDGQKLSGDNAGLNRTGAGFDVSTINEALVCAHVGDRIALTTTVADAYGEGAGASGNLADDDTLVIVLDIAATYLGKADGFNQLPQDGLPVVVTAVDGTPAIALAYNDAPGATRIEVVKDGDGAQVTDADALVVHYRAWTWPDVGEEPAEIMIATQSGATRPINTWESHRAATVTLGADSPLPPGVIRALVGSKVGSQLLVVVPPGDDHYATVPSSLPGLTADQTMIWVVDVLGVQD